MTRKIVQASFVRPADTTAYASGDLVANSTTAGSVVPMQFDFKAPKDRTLVINRARVQKTGADITDAAVRVHLYGGNPMPVTNGDNGAWESSVAAYIGFIDVTIDAAFNDGAAGQSDGDAKIALLPSARKSATVCALLEARDAMVPESGETITVILEAEVDE